MKNQDRQLNNFSKADDVIRTKGTVTGSLVFV